MHYKSRKLVVLSSLGFSCPTALKLLTLVFETRILPSPVGEKYGLSRANAIHVVGNEQAFSWNLSRLLYFLSKSSLIPPLLSGAVALCSLSGWNKVQVFPPECSRPHFCSWSDISNSFPVDGGGKKKRIWYLTVCSADIRSWNEDVINSSQASDGTQAETGDFALFKVKLRRLRALIKAD